MPSFKTTKIPPWARATLTACRCIRVLVASPGNRGAEGIHDQKAQMDGTILRLRGAGQQQRGGQGDHASWLAILHTNHKAARVAPIPTVPLTTLKVELLTPIPSASVRTATRVKPGERCSPRIA